MAKVDAFCTSCGSIINVDDTKSISKCIFCGADISTSEAIALNKDKDKRTELQTAYSQKAAEESSLAKKSVESKPKTAAVSKDKTPVKKVEVVIHPVPMKVKLALFGSIILVIAIAVAITIPTVAKRNSTRDKFMTSLNEATNITTSSHYFSSSHKAYLKVAYDSILTKDQVDSIKVAFAETYKSVFSQDVDSIADAQIIIIDKSGVYTCTYGDSGKTDFETATPTRKPTPTQGIKKP